MVRDVITRTMTAADWPAQRDSIRQRIFASMGVWPKHKFNGKYESVKKQEKDGIVIEEISFEVLPGYKCAGLIVYSASLKDGKHPGAVCIHGTNKEYAKFSMVRPDVAPNRGYALEWAKRGAIAIAVDQFGFGDWVKDVKESTLYEKFAFDYHGWSLDGIRLFIQQCAVDILVNHPKVNPEKISCIGNSLGGRLSIYLGAFDERIKAAVVSTGVSTNFTNTFRNTSIEQTVAHSPLINAAIMKNGRPTWEYEEMLSLVAPRALILLEPFNDPYNPFVETTLEAFLSARRVYELLGKPENCTLVCHGRGHGTPDEMRDYSYKLVDLAYAETLKK